MNILGSRTQQGALVGAARIQLVVLRPLALRASPLAGLSQRWLVTSPSMPTQVSIIPRATGDAADPAPADKKSIKVPVPKLDVDIKQLVTWNFLVQLALTAISWAVVFFTSHFTMAKGAGVNPTTGILMVGVGLAGYSAYLSYQYLLKVKKDGLDVLQGWTQLKEFYDHMTLNFVGAVATLLALQAEVGSMMMHTMGMKAAAAMKATTQTQSLGVEALAQASANTLFAHIISLIFLTLMIRKVTDAYKKLLDWSEKLKSSIPKFG